VKAVEQDGIGRKEQRRVIEAVGVIKFQYTYR
jgi:hypothetical protein